MKRYVFVTNSIRNMGGAQMYLRNKILFLREHGWFPTVFFFNEGDILIPELKEFEKNRIPELAYPISAVSRKKRDCALERMASLINDADDIVIETNVYPTCFWSEELAKRINGRSLLYILHEKFPSYNCNEEAFLKFKLDRGELMNGTKPLEVLLGKKWRNDRCFCMPSYSNVTTPINYPIKYDNSLKTILSIGRLDKPYIKPMLKEIVEFCEKNHRSVNLFLIGGAAEESYISEIKTYLKDKSAIYPYYFGYMFPVPENVIKASNVAIASSGSVLVPTEQGIPTISIDTQDFMAIGIYTKTTMNNEIRQNEPKQKISDLLYKILEEGKYIDIEAKPTNATLEAKSILKTHLSIIETLNAPKEYYDVYSIYNQKELLKQKVLMMVYKVLGESGIGTIGKMRDFMLNHKGC